MLDMHIHIEDGHVTTESDLRTASTLERAIACVVEAAAQGEHFNRDKSAYALTQSIYKDIESIAWNDEDDHELHALLGV